MMQGLMDSWPFKMVPVRSPKTTGRNYQYPLCNNPEERNSQLLRGGSLKSLIPNKFAHAVGRSLFGTSEYLPQQATGHYLSEDRTISPQVLYYVLPTITRYIYFFIFNGQCVITYELLICDQRDATFRDLYYYHCCTCFGHFSPITSSWQTISTACRHDMQ